MEFLADGSIGAGMLAFLVLAVLFALGFEFVNGFHDTANAVATVIYTHSLSPAQAAVWSGLWNFLGVVLSSGAVAYGIVALLPVELVLHVGTGAGFAMVFALLLSAVIWNLGTWYVGLPASSSHTLIGSIIGVGLMNGWLNGEAFGAGVNLGQLRATILALLVSPVVGFAAAALLLLVARRLVSNPALYRAPEGKAPPPLWIRGILKSDFGVDLSGVTWVQGDACDIDLLGRAGLATADVVAAVTGDDEDNLVVSLLAKQEFAVPRVVARVNNPKNEWMFNQTWGVDVSVSTPHLITGLVQEAVSVGSFVRLLSLEGGRAKLAEVTLADTSPSLDKEIGEVGLPRDSTVVAILRDEKVVVPRGETILRLGDEVLVLVTDESEEAVRALLVG